MKKILSFFIKYPTSVNILLIAFAVLGYVGMKSMNSSFFPLSESSIVTIAVSYPGASPIEMEEGIVLKIEDNLRGIIGIDRFTSKSQENFAIITIEKVKDYDIDVLLADVKNAVDKVPSFPVGMEPPIVQKVETISDAIGLVVSGKNIPLKSLKIAAREIETELKNNPQISQVTLVGFPNEELEIAVSEEKLLAYQITIEQIANAVGGSNVLTTAGSVKSETEEYLIRANNRFYLAEEIDNIVIKSDATGNVVKLKDVAKITNQFEESPNRSYYNGDISVGIDIKSTNDEDMMKIADEVKHYVEKYNKTHNNLQLSITRDSSQILKERTALLLSNAWQGILMVLILLSIFLKPRLAFWVAAGIPFSFMGMFMFASYFDVTINVLSLFGMIIVIGILVDDGIVVSENIYDHFEKGKKPLQAAIDGTLEVFSPVVSSVLTTLIAFSMFFFLDGRIGQFFGEVAIVVILTIGISLVEAIIILPSHIAHSKALHQKNEKPWIINVYGDMFMEWMKNVYEKVIRFFMQYKMIGIAIPIALFIITIGGMKGKIIKFTFFPQITSEKVEVNLAMPQGTNELVTDSIISYIETAAWKMDKQFTAKQTGGLQVVQNVIKTLGPGSATANLTINLLPGDKRDFPADLYANALDSIAGEIVGVEKLEFGSGTAFGGKPISISLFGNNLQELKAAKKELKAALIADEEFINVSDNDPQGIKEITIVLKDNAYLMGFNYSSIMKQIRSGFYGFQVQRLQQGQDELKVWVRYDEAYRSSITNLDNMRITAPDGSRIPLTELVDYTIKRGDIAINHLDGKREILIASDLKNPKASAPEKLADAKENYVNPILAKYPTVGVTYGGQNREAEKTVGSVKKVFPIIVFFIFVIIVFTFRSFSQPIILILLVPFSFIGVAWGHYFLGYAVSILSFLGVIALIGVAVNDGLVLIEKFNINLKNGMPYEESLIEAGKSRFRAIFLTSITTIAGLFPLIIFEKSRQAEFLKPMAISLAAGIAISTVITLLLLPIVLSLSNQAKVYIAYLYEGKKPTRESVESSIKELDSEFNDLDI